MVQNNTSADIGGVATPNKPTPKPTKPAPKKRPPMYSQSDLRWGKLPYTIDKDKDTLEGSGCAPTTMAMIISALTGKSILPSDMRLIAIEHHDITASSATEWDFFQHVVEHYKPLKCTQTTDFKLVLKALADPNSYVASSMHVGHFTKGGHLIALVGIDAKGNIIVNDPAGKAGAERSKKVWSQDIIKAEAKQFWIISK